MDGTSCGGKIIYSHKLPVTVFKDGVMDATTLKPFMFSSLALTGAIEACSATFRPLTPPPDDDAYLGGTSLPDLGLIELVISPVRVLPATQSYAPAPISDLSMLKVHERSKKAVTQQITFVEQSYFTAHETCSS
jgi:hypothetical protein